MMCEYSIRITGNHDILVLSPQIIGTLIEKIRCSDTKELIIPADELLPQGYVEYLESVMQTNNIEKNIGRQDVYDLTAKQVGMLKVKRQQCFDKAIYGRKYHKINFIKNKKMVAIMMEMV